MTELIICGDTGSGNYSQRIVADSMIQLIKQNPKIESVILAGDNIYEYGCDSVDNNNFNTKFQIPYSKILLPFYLCLGNHDYGKDKNISQIQIDYTTSIYNTNNKWNILHNWYTQSFPPNCDFFFIDTNIDRMNPNMIQEQLEQTIQSIQNSDKKWKILCGHHPWISVGGHGNAKEELKIYLEQFFSSVNIDLYICGHDHCKSIIEIPYKQRKKTTRNKHIRIRTRKNKNNQKKHIRRNTHHNHKRQYNSIITLVIGTGGKSYDDSLFYPNNLEQNNSILHFFSPNLGICHMKINHNSLRLICYNEKLEEEYSYVLTK